MISGLNFTKTIKYEHTDVSFFSSNVHSQTTLILMLRMFKGSVCKMKRGLVASSHEDCVLQPAETSPGKNSFRVHCWGSSYGERKLSARSLPLKNNNLLCYKYLSTFTCSVKSSYGYSSTRPFTWTAVIVPVYKHGWLTKVCPTLLR